ncbi:MAG: hypothetical protein A2041_11110 [Bacteroidetes bacterium GWA2_31_9b]|nr:MAG: hypothetical protein A2041_11110 [Bacteroidetes bacterium GWA2_31_9b]
MTIEAVKKEKARFDAKLSKEQKQFFERAATIGGYRSLTDFVISTVQEKAKRIIKERELVLATQKDSKIFFDAIMNADKPNADLSEAAKEFNKLVSE